MKFPVKQKSLQLTIFIVGPVINRYTVKGKVFPYSLPSVGPGADHSVQAVSLQVT